MTLEQITDMAELISLAITAVENARAEEAGPSLCLRSATARLEIARNYVASAAEMIELHYAGRPEKCGGAA